MDAKSLKDKLSKTPATTEWNPPDEGEIIAGRLIRVTSEEHERRDGTTWTVHYLVIADEGDGNRPKSVEVEGKALKAWFTANEVDLVPGVDVAIRFDGEQVSERGNTYRTYTGAPDCRDGDTFTHGGDLPPAVADDAPF